MLTELRVRDLAVIADATLALRPGLNVLTGETGAGKSILVDALSLLLGERASTDIVRPGAEKTVVEAAFYVGGADAVHSDADEAGVELDEEILVVRRDINVEGPNRAWANGSPTTVATLSSLGRSLVDLHGQHEAQSLLRPATQRDILDAFGGAGDERRRVRDAHAALAALRARESELRTRRDEVVKRADYLRHVAKEIEEAALEPGEDEGLATEAKRLANVEDLTRAAEQLAELLDGEGEASATAVLGAARKALDQLTKIDRSVERWGEVVEATLADVAELAREAREYASSIEVDPGRLAEVEARRDRLYRLMQKYGATIEEVRHTAAEARRELDLLDTADFDLEQMAERRAEAEQRLEEAAAALSAKREAASHRLSADVGELLPALGMPGATFHAAVAAAAEIGAHGRDDIVFLAQLNKGIAPRPVAQVASGGELSRIMLALKVVLAAHDMLPTLVFDEVDQGIGGETGQQIAEALARVARTHQVLVITHLPQIAARADHHLRITKRAKGDMATADVEVLTGDARVEEIARMLGDPTDSVLLQHARDLVGRSGVTVS
ncbi:MAG: DNA repair protein RecN [Gemmatimonadetes bacterium]|nr:DNA repair protein RecN [Gemmatimonadota bacterium]